MTETTRQYPALGRGVWLVLFRNEWFKTRHRLAFVVTWAFFAFVHTMEHGGDAYRALGDPERTHALPEAWNQIFGGNSTILLIFGSIAVVMLAASEFSWRTSRQNVIDGLDKMQWYWGKVLMLAGVGVVLVATQVGIGVTAASIGTATASVSSNPVPLSALAATAALGFAFLNVGGLALLCATTIRASGPAMAVWFAWITLGEQMLPAMVTRLIPAAQSVMGMLPFAAAQQVLAFWRFDSTTYDAMVARATEAGETAPELPNMLLWTGLNVGWAIVFIVIGALFFRRRDL